MSLRSVQNLARLALASILVTSFLGQADAGTALSIASGDAGGSEISLARDMSGLVPAKADFAVAPVSGDCGLRNIERLLETPDTSLAFVATDALYSARDEEPLHAGRLRLVASFGPQEIHIVARPDIASLGDLAGKPVNLGPEGSGSAVTGARLFTALGIEIKPVALDGASAISALQQGRIAASVVLGPRPVPLLAKLEPGSGLHLVPVDFEGPLETSYLPASLTHDDYPGLIATSVALPTVATGLLLLTADRSTDPAFATNIGSFIATLFSKVDTLKTGRHHPKWRDVNLAAALPGFVRADAAENWLNEHQQQGTQKRVVEAGMAAPAFGKDQKEALFKSFVEWQRGKSQ
jgi:TRAP transporter TAXI family solute receptor